MDIFGGIILLTTYDHHPCFLQMRTLRHKKVKELPSVLSWQERSQDSRPGQAGCQVVH